MRLEKRTKKEAIEKDPVVNDLKVPNEVQRERLTGKCTAMEAFGPFLSTRNSVQVQLSPKKKKKTLAKKRERKKKLRETDASSYVSRSLSLSLSLSISLSLSLSLSLPPSLQKES